MLFPGQIHKISSLIALLAHHRDLLRRLHALVDGEAADAMGENFLWKCQLTYTLDKDSRNITVSVSLGIVSHSNIRDKMYSNMTRMCLLIWLDESDLSW